MSVAIRALLPEDYEQTERLVLSDLPERAECIQTWPQGEIAPDAHGQYSRFYVAADAQDVVGYGSVWPQGKGRFRLDLVVASDRRRQGIGSALLTHLLEELRRQNAVIAQARTPDHRPESLTFLEKRGFSETNRMTRMRLCVADADTSPFQPLIVKLETEGFEFVTLAQEQQHTPDWHDRLLELIRYAGAHRADPYSAISPATIGTREDAVRWWNVCVSLSADAYFLAKQCALYIGQSHLWKEEEPGICWQGDTSVHLDWRQRGIATALKVQTITYARQHGFASIVTNTASPAMRALNEKLGFEIESAEIRLAQTLRAQEETGDANG